jgi:hypothetical protein
MGSENPRHADFGKNELIGMASPSGQLPCQSGWRQLGIMSGQAYLGALFVAHTIIDRYWCEGGLPTEDRPLATLYDVSPMTANPLRADLTRWIPSRHRQISASL